MDFALLSPDQVALLHSGCALIIGIAGPDGSPFATRGWGARILSLDDGRLRLVVDAEDQHRLASAHGDRVAVTATNVRNLVSVQLKGRLLRVDPAGADDLEIVSGYLDKFADDVYDTDGTERWLFERLVPLAFAACELEVAEVYDQTPGPSAGAALDQRANR